MANPKYADLPGIAHDQPDVYETSDLPESDQLSSELIVDQSESVEKVPVSAQEAYGKFKGKNLEASDVDFTDRIGRSRKTGYDLRSGEWEIVGEGTREPETPQQKYQRLQHEMRELLEEVNEVKESVKEETKLEQLSPAVLVCQVEELNKQLIELNLENVLGSELITNLSDPQGELHKKLVTHLEGYKETTLSKTTKQDSTKKTSSDDTVTYELYYKPEHSKLTEASKIATLEERLKKLEGILGPESNKLSLLTLHTNEKSIMAAINILSAKIQLLDPSNVEAIEARLVVLQHRLQQVTEKKAQVEEADKQGKIAEIYELLKKAETMSVTLPSVVDRLVALQELHQQALQFSKTLTQLDAVQQKITSSFKNNESLLQEVQENFSKNMEVIKANIASLDQRMEALKK
ncbi:dynactin subunit 2 [Tachypleus tridentatus]|uniref:dynactin subunit 2 n=1 Tax=Tachypleus tridentatus TaxID=6853 RepID=UPI003FD37474